jgi:hypothetical protein
MAMPRIKGVSNSASLYRGPVRKKRILIGSAPNIPIPIARINARIQPNTGIVAKTVPNPARTLKAFNVGKESGAI